jgi:hypothetical protein
MKTIVHVNQHVIRSNTKTGEREPALTVKTYKSNTYANEVQINGPSKVVYSPDKPLSSHTDLQPQLPHNRSSDKTMD